MRYGSNLTELKKKIKLFEEQHPDVDPETVGVSIERVEDIYFEEHGWTTQNRMFDHNEMTKSIESFQSRFYKNDDGTWELVIEAHY